MSDVALTLNDFAGLFLRQNIFDKAEVLFVEALNIRKQVFGEVTLYFFTEIDK